MASRGYYFWKPHLNEFEQVVENQGVTPSNKSSNEKRIFILGESAVEGIPYSIDMSFPGFLLSPRN